MESADARAALPAAEREAGAPEDHASSLPAGSTRKRSLLEWLRRNRDDNLTTLLLAVAALATSWSGYQASLWGGIQMARYSQSSESRTDAMRASDQAARLRMMDIVMFMNWLGAYAEHRDTLRVFYERHFRPEFRPAFNAWAATRPARDSVNQFLPFERPEYRVAATERAASLDHQAARQFRQGQDANANSDSYVFDTVILASVLFFAGAARQVVSSRARALIISIAFALLLWAIVRISASPIAD